MRREIDWVVSLDPDGSRHLLCDFSLEFIWCIMGSPEKFFIFILGKNTESLVCNMDYREDMKWIDVRLELMQ